MNGPDAVEMLLVEDGPHDLEQALHALKKADFSDRIEVARDGTEALDFISCEGPHSGCGIGDRRRTVPLDLKLPRVDGLEVPRPVGGDPRTRTIPIVMPTSSKVQGDLAESDRRGVDSYIVKPVAFEALAEAVRTPGPYGFLIIEPPAVTE
jgi:two-component system response regulator